jgi:Asp-tRNA(Asn)/Glu-tRNA(Gln) amidotransferase A subunit family amidase
MTHDDADDMSDMKDASNANDPSDDRLDRRLRRLRPELAPARDLWPAIEARLDSSARATSDRPARWPAWPLFAMAASVAVVGVLAVRLLDRATHVDPDVQVPLATVQRVAPASPFGPGYELGGGYQAARAGLVDDLEQHLASLDPEARVAVLENLETIRRAMAEINAALGDDPASVLLQNQLLATYQDELAVLANLQRVTGRLPQRNDL